MLSRKKFIVIVFMVSCSFLIFSLIQTIRFISDDNLEFDTTNKYHKKYAGYIPVCVLTNKEAVEQLSGNGTNHTYMRATRQTEKVVNEDRTRRLNDGNDICQRLRLKNISTPRFIIYTHSGVGNFKLRQKIRQTWASSAVLQCNQAINIFVLGSPSEIFVQEKIVAENQAHHDIIQGDFLDSYRNLTLKHRFALKFLHGLTFCFPNRPPLAFKTDDDVVLDLDSFTDFFLRFHASSPPRTFYCANILVNELVPRDPSFKWYVTDDEYGEPAYPPYCYGNAYLFTWDLVGDLYNASLYVQELWVDDVYFSGILTSAIGKVTLVELPLQSPIVNIVINPEDVLRMSKWLVHAWGNEEAFDEYWLGFQAKRNVTAQQVFMANVKHRTGKTFDHFTW